MYIPKHFSGKQEDAIAFMKRFNFATIVTSVENTPVATHLPFVISERNGAIVVTSHFAKVNQQTKHIEDRENLVIFTEPHAYISPSLYEKKQNVPTWNYVAVHVYGKAKIISDLNEVLEVLEKMINSFEPGYIHQWNELSSTYKTNMAKGIVAFEIEIEKLLFTEKLSQNKKESEKKRISGSLLKSPDANERILGEYMNDKYN